MSADVLVGRLLLAACHFGHIPHLTFSGWGETDGNCQRSITATVPGAMFGIQSGPKKCWLGGFSSPPVLLDTHLIRPFRMEGIPPSNASTDPQSQKILGTSLLQGDPHSYRRNYVGQQRNEDRYNNYYYRIACHFPRKRLRK